MRILFGEAWRGLRSEPTAAIISVLVVGLALYIPAMLYLSSEAGGQYARQIQAQVKIRAYIKDPPGEPPQSLQSRMKALGSVRATRLLSPDSLLAELEAELGGDLLRGLPDNPLPWAVEISVAKGRTSEAALDSLANVLAAFPEVDDVVYGRQWARQAERFFADVRWFLGVVTVGLSLLVFAIAANIIRLIIRARRTAIGVWLLLGATPLYARVPYYIEGAVAGFGGAVFSLLLAYVSYLWLRLYVTTFRFFTGMEILAFFGIAIIMGLLGAVVAARRRIVPL